MFRARLSITIFLALLLVLLISSAVVQADGVTVTATSGLRIRTGSSTDYAGVGNLPIGTSAAALARNPSADWFLIEHGGVRGWVAGWLTDITGDPNSLPVSEERTGPAVLVRAQSSAVLRSGPGTQYALVTLISSGYEVPAYGRSSGGGWFLVEHNGLRGWVAGGAVWLNGNPDLLPITDDTYDPGGSLPPPGSPGNVTLTPRNTLNLRGGPGTNYQIVGQAQAGIPLTPKARSVDTRWAIVETNGVEGWIAVWLCDVSGDLNSLPVRAAPAPPSAPPPPPPTGGSGALELGGQTHTLSYPGEMRYSGMTWVKFQIKFSPGMSPEDALWRINKAHEAGLKVMLSIPGPYRPDSIDYPAYIDFVGGVAALGPDAIEVWNEPNLDAEWPTGQLNPATYVNQMLAPAYRAIKAANPNVMVISAGLAPTGVHNGVTVWSDDIYLAGMRDAGAAQYMDCLGVHYNAGATSPDARTGHPAAVNGGYDHYSWYFWPTYELYHSAFPGKPLCYTEIGYLTPEGYGTLEGGPNWWANDTSIQEQADWLARSVVLLRGTGKVRLMIVFNVDITYYTPTEPQGGYAMIRNDRTCPACDALYRVMK